MQGFTNEVIFDYLINGAIISPITTQGLELSDC